MTAIRRLLPLLVLQLAPAVFLPAQTPPPTHVTHVEAGKQSIDIIHEGPPAPPPDPPGSIQIVGQTATQTTLTWDAAAAAPNHTIHHYEIYLNGVKVATTTDLSLNVAYDPAGPYLQFFSVVAVDDSGHRSTVSDEILATPLVEPPVFELQAKYASSSDVKRGFTDASGKTYDATSYSNSGISDEYTDEGTHIAHFEDSLLISETFDLEANTWSSTVTGEVNGSRSENYYTLNAGTFHSVWKLVGDHAALVGNYSPGARVTLPSVRAPSTPAGSFISTAPLTWSRDAWNVVHNHGTNVSNHTTSYSYSDEYTDDKLVANTLADCQMAKALAAGVAWPQLGWDVAASVSEGYVIEPAHAKEFYDGRSEFVAAREASLDYNGNLYRVSALGSVYRLHSARPGPTVLRWLERFQPFHSGPDGRISDGPAQTTVREETVTGDVTGAWTIDHALDPPATSGGIDIVSLAGTIRLQTASLYPAPDAPRLYLKDAIFVGEGVVVELLGIHDSTTTSAIVQLSGDAGSATLVKVEPWIIAVEGMDAAIAQGSIVANNTDLLGDSARSLFTGGLVVVGTAPGTLTLTLKMTTAGFSYDLVKTIPIYPRFEAAVDADRDGQIKLASEDASDQTSADQPFRFWLNDDFDFGDEKSTSEDDVSVAPGLPGRNADDYGVNGVRDLVDFFPVFLDIKTLLTTCPPSAGFKFKLKQADGAVNIVHTGLTRATVLQYQTVNVGAVCGLDLTGNVASALSQHVTPDGIDIFANSPAFLDAVQNHDGGVLLVEGRLATTQPLVLSVEKADGTAVIDAKLWLSIDRVQSMFRYYNIRPLANAVAMTADDTGPNSSYPLPAQPPNDPFQGLPNRKNVVFIHGYNVGGKEASGTIPEMFKRMYWAGSKANFYGVEWRGNDHNLLDYQLQVGHVWQQAPHVRNLLRNLTGDTVMIAHSLGNMVTLAALNYDRDSSNSARIIPASRPAGVKNYFAIDAAVPLEALAAVERTSATKANMVHPSWIGYEERLWPTEWHSLFPPSDARSAFTWLDRFAALDIGTNFYSSGDEVLDNPVDSSVPSGWDLTHPFGHYAWVGHEKTKGGYAVAPVQVAALPFLRSTHNGGWGDNVNWWIDGGPDIGLRRRTPSEANATGVPTSSLPSMPFFQQFQWSEDGTYYPGYQGQRLMAPIGDTNADDEARKLVTFAKVLGEGMPSLSYAQGRNSSSKFLSPGLGTNLDLSTPTFQKEWPASRATRDWRHGDYIVIPYRYIYPLFEKIATDGGLK